MAKVGKRYPLVVYTVLMDRWRPAVFTLGLAMFGVAFGFYRLGLEQWRWMAIAAVGAFWSARVAHYVADPLKRGATSAPAIAQVESLKDTFVATAILISIAFILSLWALLREIRRRYHSLSVPDLEYANEKEYRR